MTKAEASFMKLVVQNRFDHVEQSPVGRLGRGLSECPAVVSRSVFPVWECERDEPHWGDRFGFDFFGRLSCFHEQMLFERFTALPIDSGCFLLPGHLAGGRVKIQLERKLCQSTRAICLLSLCFPKVSSTFGPSKQQAEPTGECPASLQSV